MPVSMYSVSIPVFMQHLNGLSGVLDKAAAWATARKVNEADLLNMRLSPDMFNLARQIRAATDHAANCAGRLSGKEAARSSPTTRPRIAQFKDRIAKTIEFLKSVKQSEVDGTEGKEIKFTFPNGQVRDFTGQSLLLGNAACRTSISTPPPPTTSSASAASRSASATSWAPRRRKACAAIHGFTGPARSAVPGEPDH